MRRSLILTMGPSVAGSRRQGLGRLLPGALRGASGPSETQARRQAEGAAAALLATTLRHGLHHLAHGFELLEQLVDLAHLGPRPTGDPGTAGTRDDAGVVALAGGHRPDDGLELHHVL